MLGVKDFCRRGHAAGLDAALICEPEGYEVCIAQKGALRLRVRCRGGWPTGRCQSRGATRSRRSRASSASSPGHRTHCSASAAATPTWAGIT